PLASLGRARTRGESTVHASLPARFARPRADARRIHRARLAPRSLRSAARGRAENPPCTPRSPLASLGRPRPRRDSAGHPLLPARSARPRADARRIHRARLAPRSLRSAARGRAENPPCTPRSPLASLRAEKLQRGEQELGGRVVAEGVAHVGVADHVAR